MKGLNNQQVAQRKQQYGVNQLTSRKSKSKFEIIIEILKDPIILIMVTALILSVITNLQSSHFAESYVIFTLIVLNCTISFIQEQKTLSELASLEAMNEDTVTVIRNSRQVEIKAKELVVDDLVCFRIGHIVRADLKLIEANNLQVDEAFLTGESEFVNKSVDNIIYSNSSIQNGTGIGIVTAVGMSTAIGKIAQQVTDIEETKSQLELKILEITKLLMKVAVIMSIVIFSLTLASDLGLNEAFSIATSILIATVPEGLATVLTIVLTFMSTKIAHENALVKKVKLLETLGEVSFVCSDKTGTITENKMQVVEKQFFTEIDDINHVLELIIDEQSPTTKAISEHINIEQLRSQIDTSNRYRVVESCPFNSQAKYSMHTLNSGTEYYLFAVGAPDILVDQQQVEPYFSNYGQQGLRPILVAYKQLTNNQDVTISNLIPVCLFGIQDSPKQSAITAISQFEKAGITPVMITGDNQVTARSIGRQSGIIQSDDDLVLTHNQLKSIDDEELLEIVTDVKVYARAKPEDKVRIVKALQASGQVVAMIGDGTNDSIALRQADIGIAMGINGTDISKEAADLILLDDNYATTLSGIQAGRLIFINIQKFVRQMLTSNTAHTSTILFALIADVLFSNDVILPLTPVLILWINIVSDAIPCLALGLDGPEGNLMTTPPIKASAKLLPVKTIAEILLRGMTIGLLVLVGFNYIYELTGDVMTARSVGFIILSFGQLIHIFDARSTKTIYSRNPFSNRMLVALVLVSAGLNLTLVYTPLSFFFGLTPINIDWLLTAIVISSIPTFVYSLLRKLVLR